MGTSAVLGAIAVVGLVTSTIVVPLLQNAICVNIQNQNNQQDALNANLGRPLGSGCQELPDYCKKCKSAK